jgi:prepilin-type processing-associated H-X9-DG protein
MIAIGDSFRGWKTLIVDGRQGSIGLRYNLSAREGETSRALRRHDTMGNYLFCDGHVDGIRLERLFFDAATKDARLWNRDNQPHLERMDAGQ